jgi:hypothetical protein
VGATGQGAADVQQAPDLHLNAGLLAHSPDQGGAGGLALFDLPAGKGPGATGACPG